MEEIARLASLIYAGRDYHHLSETEEALVKALETEGYLIVKDRPDGFIGKSILPA